MTPHPRRLPGSFLRLWTLGFGLWTYLGLWTLVCFAAAVTSAAEPFPGTEPLETPGDLADQMVAGIDRFLLKQIDASAEHRGRYWKRDFTSAEKYNESVAENRKHLAKIIGAFDPREPITALEYIETTAHKALVGRGDGYEVYAVRWPVLRGMTGEGLLLVPVDKKPVANVVALPDADQTPEMLVGLVPGVEPEAQFARRLAESGCRVVVPMLIDRADTFSIAAGGARPTNQPHREFIYRQAFEMGRHVIGYEVQKILALVDWFTNEAKGEDAKIGAFGYAEGGLLALYAGALDTRIDVTCVSGYFGPRERVWEEPIYRNVFGLLDEFGDAELASLIAPRGAVFITGESPKIDGPPEPRQGRTGAAPGRWSTPDLNSVKAEFERARALVGDLKQTASYLLVSGTAKADEREALAKLLKESGLNEFLGILTGETSASSGNAPTYDRPGFNPQERLKRQLDEMTEYTQHLMREGEYTRKALWSKASRKSVDEWRETSAEYRKMFADEVIGRFEIDRLPPKPRSRKVYDEAKYTGYDVVLDVFPDVFAYGILLVPKDIKQGEQRPVVVCQHGLEGRPQDVADPKINSPYYNQFAIRLAERGFITFSPQNPYIFTDRFRTLQRKSNVLRKTLFSTIVPQHQQITDWLASLPMVDPKRIGFYGLSYGGKSAMRIPALVDRYCLSICSADFNEWIWKNTSTRAPYSYIGTGEYEIFEFDLGNTFNYAEMAGLICPRPFMVERGHHDGVAPDEWVAYEFAKVRLLYSDLKIPERTTIEFFDGPHTIHGVGTYAFLHQHLNWPEPAVPVAK